jgi:hypothetical protein
VARKKLLPLLRLLPLLKLPLPLLLLPLPRWLLKLPLLLLPPMLPLPLLLRLLPLLPPSNSASKAIKTGLRAGFFSSVDHAPSQHG